MYEKKLDFLAIGDITTDAFIRLKEAELHCQVDKENCQISMDFGSKIPYEFVEIVKGVGNSANAAVTATRLGLSSALITNVGDDIGGRECREKIASEGISTEYFLSHAGKTTNYHYVLWYGDDRTILVKHEDYKYRLPKFENPKWIYLSSMGAGTRDYLKEFAVYVKKNSEVKICFQPGTFQMGLGMDEVILPFYEHSEVFVVNVEEAQRILKTHDRDVKNLMKAMRALGPKIVLITDGHKGAYMNYNNEAWFMPIYPDPKPPYERTGAGDAFASTFASALALGKSPEEALMWAPVNPMSVVQYIGAQKGLLTRPQIEKLLKTAPIKYKPERI